MCVWVCMCVCCSATPCSVGVVDEQVLTMILQEEAVEGRRRMTESQDVLVPSLRGKENVEPPYSNAQISETVTHREILRIYRMARPETKVVYDLGRDTDRVEEENWVIRWMLWHVFRYRDSRNRNRRHISPSPERLQPPHPSIAAVTSSSRGSSHLCEFLRHCVTSPCKR